MLMADQRDSTVEIEQQRDAAEQLKAAWRNGARADAAAAVAQLGGPALHRSIVLELAYEEYCLLREAGESVDTDRFLKRFPRVARTLKRQICIHEALSARGVLADPDGLPEWPVAGDIIAGFRLLEELGRGSFGRVFRASEINLDERQVVVKLAKRGLHEAQLLARVPHAGVVPVYSVATDRKWDLTVLCMPFISRATLRNVIDIVHADQTRPPTCSSVIAMAARSVNCEQDTLVPHSRFSGGPERGTFADGVSVFGYLVAGALKTTHSAGIFHRDLKPSNILVDQFGCPLLIDFNLSSEPLQEMPLGGTLPYMAPEQLLAFLDASAETETPTTVEVGAAADLFSLGACLFELLYGIHPFAPIPSGLSNIELGHYLLERQALGPGSAPLREQFVDARLKNIISRCLEFDAARRPQSAQELADALQDTLTLGNRWRRIVRLYPRLAKTGVLSLAGSVLGAAVWFNSLPSESEHLRNLADTAFRSGHYADALAPLNQLLLESPDNETLLTLRGQAYLKTEKYAEAVVDLEALYNRAPTAETATKIAWCNIQLGQNSVAARWYQRILNEFSETASTHNNLGYTLAREGAFSKAIEHYNRALELSPNHTLAILNRAEALFQQSLQNGQPTPLSALQDLQLSEYGRMATGETFLLACRICSNLEPTDQARFLQALQSCVEHQVPRNLLESDKSVSRMRHLPGVTERLQQLPVEGGSLSRSRRLVPPP
ncbi:MAG: serine/threonine-protein kinase [Fuerstiella sp.]